MIRQVLFAAAVLIGLSGSAFAGHFYHRHYYVPAYGVAGVAVAAYPGGYVAPGYVYPISAAYGVPVTYSMPLAAAVPMAVYQPAYVVPSAPVAVAAYPFGTVTYASPAFAPMVPMAYGYGRPHHLDVRMRVYRDGGYRYRVHSH